jgi:hypothetical protein
VAELCYSAPYLGRSVLKLGKATDWSTVIGRIYFMMKINAVVVVFIAFILKFATDI